MATPITTLLHLPPNPKPPPPLLSFHHQSSLRIPATPHPTSFPHLCATSHRNSSTPTPTPPTPTEVDMVLGRDGIYSASDPTVVILWDLDNKPPRGPPFECATALRSAASRLGNVITISAYANLHAFTHVPAWVSDQRRERRQLDILERRGQVAPDEPYRCSVCGRRCATRPDLTRHFKQLHLRERNKKLARLNQLKGNKRRRYREKFIDNNTKYQDAARELLTPRVGYGLAAELKRAGVKVRTVEDKPQAADAALKRQMRESMARGVDWMVLVSDDSDFTEMVKNARKADFRTVVVGDERRALGNVADIWLPWGRVESGDVDEEMLRVRPRRVEEFVMQEDDDNEEEEEEEEDGKWRMGDFDVMVDDIVVGESGDYGRRRMSAFSDEDVMDEVSFTVEFGEDGLFWVGGDDDEGDDVFF